MSTQNTIDRILSKRTADEVVLHNWQFALARRIAQILEKENITQRQLARRVKLTDSQVSALLHASANPTLAVLARIAGLLDEDILQFVNTDETGVSQPTFREESTPIAAKTAPVYSLQNMSDESPSDDSSDEDVLYSQYSYKFQA